MYDGDGCFDEAVYLNHDNKYSLYVKVGGLWLRDLLTKIELFQRKFSQYLTDYAKRALKHHVYAWN